MSGPSRPRAVRIGVADSGINPRDPQVGGVEGGVGVRFRNGRIERDESWEDLLGHGTAVAATIRGHAPAAALYSIRIFRRRLEAPIDSLLEAIDWAVQSGLDLLNLSLGFSSDERRAEVLDALTRASAAGLAVVAAAAPAPADPGAPREGPARRGVIRVVADVALEIDQIRNVGGTFHASPWARPRGELPREKNFHGTSFAVANVSGLAARLMAELESSTVDDLPRALSRLSSR